MKVGKQNIYHDILHIPEGRSGDVYIKHLKFKAGEKVLLATSRDKIFSGYTDYNCPKYVVYAWDTIFHELADCNGRWMTDLPIEQRQHDEQMKTIRSGHVLVGGLGVGYAAHILALKERVQSITVVEINPDVIKLVEPYMVRHNKKARAKITVVQDDLLEYLKTYNKKAVFTHAFYDIWRSDGETTFFQTVCPLLELSKRIVKKRPVCWNETVMRGQLFHSINTRIIQITNPIFVYLQDRMNLDTLTKPEGDIFWDWTIPFFRWYKDKGKTIKGHVLNHFIGLYAQSYGWNLAHEFRPYTI